MTSEASTPETNTVVRQQIVVAASIEDAFAVFTGRFGDFKPPEHNLLAVPIAETVFEPRVGGYIYDRGTDGSQCRWARVLAYEPPNRVVFSWDIGPTWQLETDPRTPARSRSDSPPTHRTARLSRSNTATSTATDPAGKRSPTASAATRAGRCTSTGTQPCSARAARWPRSRLVPR
jgi:uncharacterized protein YndB with AHSA1/START domain